MRVLILMAAAAVALGGCETTLSNMRANEQPRVTYDTAKSVDATVRCLTSAYAGLRVMPSVLPTDEGTTITFPVANRMFADVRPTGTGSRVTFYRAGSLLLAGEYQQATESCRD